MRFSQLKKLLKEIVFDPELGLDIRCTTYRIENGAEIGRYWIVLNKETIWSYPARIEDQIALKQSNPDIREITVLLRGYLDTPKDQLLSAEFPQDRFGLIELLRAADRRIGKRRLVELKASSISSAALLLIKQRLESR